LGSSFALSPGSTNLGNGAGTFITFEPTGYEATAGFAVGAAVFGWTTFPAQVPEFNPIGFRFAMVGSEVYFAVQTAGVVIVPLLITAPVEQRYNQVLAEPAPKRK
jgi:hypothetical protein